MSVEQYDPVANPYAPGAGTPPPTLVGRDQLIEGAEISLRRLIAKRSTQHLMLTGLRGVGKTVLLGTLAAVAEHVGFRVIRHEAVGGDDTVASLLRQSRRILDDLEPGPRVARAFRSIDSVSLTVAGTGVKIDKARRGADREALADVIADLATAAGEEGLGVMLAIDEAHMVDDHDLRRILAGVHRCGQDGLPLWCLLAGLPNLVGEIAKAATYAERMFTVGDLGPLSPAQVVDAVRIPAETIGVTWSDAATEAIVDRSDGFPFFVQIWAYHTWNAADRRPDLARRRTPRRAGGRPHARRLVLRRPHRPHPVVRGGVRAGAGVARTRSAPVRRRGRRRRASRLRPSPPSGNG